MTTKKTIGLIIMAFTCLSSYRSLLEIEDEWKETMGEHSRNKT